VASRFVGFAKSCMPSAMTRWRGDARASRRRMRLVAGGLLAASPHLLADVDGAECSSQFKLPNEAPPLQATDYNGAVLEDVCFGANASKSVFVVGDWGGIVYRAGMPPIPADKRSKLFPAFHRDFVWGVDDRAQLLVAQQMRARARWAHPDFIVNVGDNFYWGGVEGKCGALPFDDHAAQQWKHIFEEVYWGPGLDGKMWLGILGNHDYGGYHFQAAWDNTIGYSWGKSVSSTKRWLTPSQYYSQKVNYDEFSAEYYFIDSNVNEAWAPEMNPSHNICGIAHNGKDGTCGAQGPRSVDECFAWFHELWDTQMRWLEERLDKSTATWQIVVTHFPPKWATNEWHCFAERYGIDMHISGHLHFQSLVAQWDDQNVLKGSTVLISGGGGGITSEFAPHAYGDDDAYGFMHLTFSKDKIKIEAISHGGVIRRTATQTQRWPNKNRGVCIGPPAAKHFELQGGPGHACRGKDEHDDAGTNYDVVQNVPTPESCMRRCRSIMECKGVEYGNKVCKIWTVDIKATVPLKGFSCLKLLPWNGQDPQVPSVDGSWPSAALREVGRGYECRSSKGTHESFADYDFNTSPTLAGCELLCLHSTEKCTGIEYGPRENCLLWRVPITASEPRKDVVCIPAVVPDVLSLDVVEAGGLLHV